MIDSFFCKVNESFENIACETIGLTRYRYFAEIDRWLLFDDSYFSLNPPRQPYAV
jgi:hypothetical protein